MVPRREISVATVIAELQEQPRAAEVRMVDIRRILCPIDFSDTSRHALKHAISIAKWYESHITVLHVIHPAFMPQPPIPVAGFPKSALPTGTERQSLEEQLRAWLEPERRVGVKTDMLVEEGSPAPHLLEQASSLQADLIVMGHMVSGFERFMLGSVAEGTPQGQLSGHDCSAAGSGRG